MLNVWQGRNTGMKAMFGGSTKKPLMTKVSMRHLNEIVRERNQYSRDAMEAWQDFINLKGRMDTELNKVSKRNNFLVEELESWKQQFLKFQAFAEQLTKETQDLKVKIESHKRENRRLTVLIDQQKDDAARLTVRLSGTEKQRDDALEALVLQQDIAEELERERKRNQKELAALKHTNATLLRQRDESQRVVLHLRSLIDGQTHHMEHIVRSLNKTPDIPDYASEDPGADAYSDIEDSHSAIDSHEQPRSTRQLARLTPRAFSRTSTRDENLEGEYVSPEMETSFYSLPNAVQRSASRLSIVGVADRHLRDKTDAIADIIRNISEQCAAAVEGLQLAHSAEDDSDDDDNVHLPTAGEPSTPNHARDERQRKDSLTPSQASEQQSSSLLHPTDGSHSRTSSIPPTPDLVHHDPHRSSTSMSMASASTGAQDRNSGSHYGAAATAHRDAAAPKIVEDENESVGAQEDAPGVQDMGAGQQQLSKKHSSAEFIRPRGEGTALARA